MNKKSLLTTFFILTVLLGCTTQPSETAVIEDAPAQTAETSIETAETPATGETAETPATGEAATVTSVEVSGTPMAYTFDVTVQSPDTGCDQYADWWEVVTQDGVLLYRRILDHSHTDEQPFKRSGGPVAAEADQPVIVRVHMNNSGYSPQAMQGIPNQGFLPATLTPDFAASLSDEEPQPTGCAF